MHSSLIKQEVWPPGLANMVCSHSPLMTQVQHFVSQIKKRQRWDVQMMWAIDFDLWPWSSPRLSVIHVLVFCQSTKCKFRSIYCPHGSDIPLPRDLATLTFNLGGYGTCCWCGSTSSIRIRTLKFLGLTVRKIWHILCVCVSRPVTLTFDLETGSQCSTCHGVSSCQFWWY